MKNKLITSSLLLLLTFALASCQNGGGDRTKKDSYKVRIQLDCGLETNEKDK